MGNNPPTLCTTSIPQDLKKSTYRMVLVLVGHVVGQLIRCSFHACSTSWRSCPAFSTLSFHSAPSAPDVGNVRRIANQTSTAQWESGGFHGYFPTRLQLPWEFDMGGVMTLFNPHSLCFCFPDLSVRWLAFTPFTCTSRFPVYSVVSALKYGGKSVGYFPSQ